MNEIIQIISTLGFPIAMCVGACFFIKYQFDTSNKQMEDIRKDHKEEIKALKDSLDNNTIALTKLLDKLNQED
jgi:hypothetical protein